MPESNISPIESRRPIIGPEVNQVFSPDAVDRQWRLVTEATRRELIAIPEVRRALSGFCTTPVSETLPEDFLKAVSSVDPRIANLADRFNAGIRAYLELPPVPNEQVVPDIRHALPLVEPREVIDGLMRLYGDKHPRFEASLREYVKSGTFLRGITAEERLLIARRYKYARDVKLLALGAEIADQGTLLPNVDGEVVLPSGIKLVVDVNQDERRHDLLNPNLWERRTQLKDRVFEIVVGGRKYILKERKTSRHTDTKRHGHIDGRLSSEEFEIARHFQDHGTVSKGEVGVCWERPVGYGSYPDGFSFAVFEHEEGLGEDGDCMTKLAQKILEHRDRFQAEYELIAMLSEKYKDSPEVLAFENCNSETWLRALLRWLRGKKDSPPGLTFEEFAMVKALRMKRQARDLMQETLIKNGYDNSDLDGYSFRIEDGDPLKLMIVGFDFEYFSKMSSHNSSERLTRFKEIRSERESRDGVGFLMWEDGSFVSRMQKAAYFAMIATEGIVDDTLANNQA